MEHQLEMGYSRINLLSLINKLHVIPLTETELPHDVNFSDLGSNSASLQITRIIRIENL